jgi:hypothetical protein
MALICSQLSCMCYVVASLATSVDHHCPKSKRGKRSQGRQDGMRGLEGGNSFDSFAVILHRRSTGRVMIVQ